MDNYITHLHANGVGIFEQLDVSFNPGFNFIVGPNSCGKTSILRCLALALFPLNAKYFRFEENPSVWFDAVFDDDRYRIGVSNFDMRNFDVYQQAQARTAVAPMGEDGMICFSPYDLKDSHVNIAPLFLGAYRHIIYKMINGVAREPEVNKSRSIYRESGIAQLDGSQLPAVKQWMINRYFQIEKDWATTYKANWEWILGHLDDLSPTNCSLEFKQIKGDLEPVFTLNGYDCYLEEISAGFQAILSLVFSIVEWIEETNEGEDALIQNATGTVIIDELDVHLHPEWQFTIRESLRNIFPHLQFIITTHSPHLISSAAPGELIILPELTRRLTVGPTPQSYNGWNTDEILADIMGVRSLENKVYSVLIQQAMENVAQHDLDALKQSIKELQNILHPSNTILQVLQTKLAALQLGDTHDQDN